MHGLNARKPFVHVHAAQQRLIEAGLELVGDDEEAVLRQLERLGGLGLGKAVHAGFGVGFAAILHRS